MIDQTTRHDLALAYRIISYLKMDDHTYTHISMRPTNADYFYIAPFGLCFGEIMPRDLLKIPLHKPISRTIEEYYNLTGYMTHSSIYRTRPDLNAAIHVHTHEIVAVSSIQDGLMPLSQWALHFYKKISYFDYNSLILEEDNSDKIASSLGTNSVMMMRNHGSITCGKDIQEAMFYTYHLQQACKTQVQALGMNKELIMPSHETCTQAVKDLLSFEQQLGHRDWKAWSRLINF
jgi:ribulose-5-phosphate 4-epimerase/fuculose-1-phosphate aldolase